MEATNSTQTCQYSGLEKYIDEKNGCFKININEQPTITEFEIVICEKIIPVAKCMLNTPQNFGFKTKKDGTPCKKQREYYLDPTDESYNGKKIDYKPHDVYVWKDEKNEWLYIITYNDRIVKIGMTITSLKERYESYSCGTARAMKKGSCSTTNYIISECNCLAVLCGMNVEIYGIRIPKDVYQKTRFGLTDMTYDSKVREDEKYLAKRFHTVYGHKPFLCVQEGK